MGRPLNKRYFGNQVGALLLGFAQRPRATGSTVPPQKGVPPGDDQYIVEQKSVNRFKIRSANVPEERNPYILTNNGGLDPSSVGSVGQFNIDGYKDDGTQIYIKKIYNRTVIYEEDGVMIRSPWIKNDNFITVDSRNNNDASFIISSTGTDNVAVTAPTAFIANLNVGETIAVTGVRDEINGDQTVASKESDNTGFTIDLLSSAAGTAGTSTGVALKKFPGYIIFDFKNAVTT